ncbi:gp53-like domain-containing protein [Lonsdalea quercina]|uniref:gp53-like domain-containing protein n=1 Tax=Lonsdalea quercina TaxID=71657 RepID=UPI0039769840
MHRIDTSTAQVDKFGAGKNGFTRGNPQTGTLATQCDDDYFDALQEEICAPIEAAGLSLEKGNRGQLLTALRRLFPAASAFGASLAGAGWQKLPSGLIIQWGIVSGTSGKISGTYPIAFPNAVLQVVASLADKTSGITAGISLYVNNETFSDKSVLTMLPIGSDGVGSTAVRFIAIGY